MRLFAIICAVFSTALCISPAGTKPNVIVILTDDQGWGDLSLSGNTNLQTPNIDSLAKDGASFERFFVCPVCSPTRAEFLTGRYAIRSGVYSTSAGGERMNLDEKTIAEVFKDSGYTTGAFGKWHNGMQYPYHPNGRGFDEFYGFCSGHWGDYFSSPILENNGKIVKGDGFIIDDFTNRAIRFIEENKDTSFFTYLPYNTPHSPMQVPDEYWDRMEDKEFTMHNREPEKENNLHLRAALAMCENIDWNVGRLLRKLDELGIADNTIVAYFHDNGPNGVRWNGDMKGRKGSTDEGGVRSPLLLRWPVAVEPGTVVKTNGAAIDLLPTLANMAEIKISGTKPLDGISLKAAILGENNEIVDRTLISSWKGKVSARSDRFRLGNKGQFFDIDNDPGQRVNVADQFPREYKKLKDSVSKWKAENLPRLTQETDNRPFVIGHPDYRYSQIPARDGIPSGSIKRSNKYPNDSFFHNWVNAEDYITWKAEVASPGKYEVEIYYTCPPEDAGSTIELSFQDAKLQGKISRGHDSPLLGAEKDRSPRMESYTKDFTSMKLGTIELPAGPGTLKLSAVSKIGTHVMDFRLMMLTRVE
ncbi:MAG: arylsulfatase [Verrucomicrobiales bacterium]|nr:arylsulfatase [Verrucomicrobiales bacterium]